MRWLERGEGVPVVFVHGLPTSPRLWRHVLPRIAQARCLAFEMVGYGTSIPDGRGRHISVSRQADYLLAWLDALDISRALLVGHDLGGGVVQIAAVRRPEICAGLVLTNSIAYDSWPIPQVQALRLLGPAVERLPNFVFERLFRSLLRWGHDDPKRAEVSASRHWELYAEHDAAGAFLRQIRSLHTQDTLSVADALPRLGVPARIVWGAADPFQALEYGQRLSHDLGAPLARIERAGHFTPEDHPDAVAEAVVELLREGHLQQEPARRRAKPSRAKATRAKATRAKAKPTANPKPKPSRPSAPAAAPEQNEPPTSRGAQPPRTGRQQPEPPRTGRQHPDWERREQAKLPPRGSARGETDPLLEPRPGERPPPRDPAPKRRTARSSPTE